LAPAGFVGDHASAAVRKCGCLGDCLFGMRWFAHDFIRKLDATIYDKKSSAKTLEWIHGEVWKRYRNNPGYITSVEQSVHGFPLHDCRPQALKLGANEKLPVLLLWGEHDAERGQFGCPFAGHKEYQKCMPKVTFIALKGLAHLFYLEAPDLAHRLIGEFLAGRVPKLEDASSDKKE